MKTTGRPSLLPIWGHGPDSAMAAALRGLAIALFCLSALPVDAQTPEAHTPNAHTPDAPVANGVAGAVAAGSPSRSLPRSVYIEDLTWTEVRDALANGVTGALLYAGSTEQNGPHLALGKHNFMARWVGGALARSLGTVLAYPVLPFAPTGDVVARTGHMRFPGSVSLSASTYALVMAELAASARAAGFSRIFLLGDHAAGEPVLAQLALELDRLWVPDGVRVLHVAALNVEGEQRTRAFLASRGLRVGDHAGLPDAAALMAIDEARRWVHPEQFGKASVATGVDGDPRGATAALGQVLLQIRVDAALEQIRRFEAGLVPTPRGNSGTP